MLSSFRAHTMRMLANRSLARLLSALTLTSFAAILLSGSLGFDTAGVPSTANAEAGRHRTPDSAVESSRKQRAVRAYGELPLAFEEYRGEAGGTGFTSRGAGYQLFLGDREAVINLNKPAAPKADQGSLVNAFDQHGRPEKAEPQKSSTLRMTLVGASRVTNISGADELPGKVNYLIGNDPAKWRTGVPTYAAVRYTNVYDGIDLVYYGNHQQLEYDFVVAPGADPNRIRLSFTGANRINVDAQGELVLHTDGGDVRQHKPVIYQEIGGVRHAVGGRYVRSGENEVAFAIARYNKGQPLTIDPVLIYSTFLGGNADDFGTSITVDSAGSAYVAGYTSSSNFPISHGLQTRFAGDRDAFVTKLSPDGSSVVYSTFIGGSDYDRATGIAVDSAGSAYVTGYTGSADFPTKNPLQPDLASRFDGFVLKLSSDGSNLIYSTYLGGRGSDVANGIAVDAGGSAYIVGSTSSPDFPVVNAVQSSIRSRLVIKSVNEGADWAVSDAGINAAYIVDLVVDPAVPTNLYALTSSGLFKSVNGGNSWSLQNGWPPTAPLRKIVIDPVHTATLYSPAQQGVLKSTDGGNTWDFLKNPLANSVGSVVAIDPVTTNTIYTDNGFGRLFKSVDGGNTWTPLSLLPDGVNDINNVAIDPNDPATIFVGTASGVVKSSDGGNNWNNLAGFVGGRVDALAIDPRNTGTIYAAANGDIFKSTDGGTKWISTNPSFQEYSTYALAIDPKNPSVVYAATGYEGGLIKTTDGGNTWSPQRTGLNVENLLALAINPQDTAVVYGAENRGADAFVAKLNPAGSALVYSTYLGGADNDTGVGIALDVDGNAYITGSTASSDFPTVNPFQAKMGGNFSYDGFVAKLNSSGNGLIYSTYLGGDQDDSPACIAVDSTGSAFVAGNTFSANFPLFNALQSACGPGGSYNNADAFVTKLSAKGSTLVYSTYLCGGANDGATGISVDASGNAFVAGTTSSSNFPTVNAVQATYQGGGSDAFVTELNPSGQALVFSSYLGGSAFTGSGNDLGAGIAVDSSGAVYVTGVTKSNDFPVVNPFQGSSRGGFDAFVTKIAGACAYSISSPGQSVLASGGTGSVAVTTTGTCPWTASSNAAWISISSGGSGNGNGTVSFTVAANSSASGRTGTLTIGGQTFTVTQAGVPQTVQFSQPTHTVNEGGQSATITVTRSGDLSGAATVDYATSDGTASQMKKYIASIGTLSFGPNEASKTFNVMIIDEAYQEGNQTVNLTLSNPSGTALGNPSTATLTIIDNDTAPPAANPLNDGRFFAEQQYMDFLNRLPESQGWSDWSNYVNGCGATDYQCQVDRRVATSAGFFRSPEFFSTGYFVMRMYRATLYPRPAGDVPSHPTYQEFLHDAPSVHYGVAGDTLAASKLSFAQNWVQRADFLELYPLSLSTADFIDRLAQTAQVTLAPSDRAALSALNRAQIVIQIVDNAQVDAREYNAAFVTMQYMGYLRRMPEKDGYLAWLSYLDANPNNCAIMINGFAFSREYRERFGLYGDQNQFPTASMNSTSCGH